MFSVLKNLREAKSYSQKELADAVGVSIQTIDQYESDQDNLSLGAVKKLSKFFDVDYACFIDNKMPKACDNMRICEPQEYIEKFKQVLSYVLFQVRDKPNISQSVLYKLLYFIDFDYYELYEEQLMGMKYIKTDSGPEIVGFDKIVDKMIENKILETIETKYLPIGEPELNLLSAPEIKHIDHVLEKHSDKTEAEFYEFSHLDIPWIATKPDVVIKYEAVFYRNENTAVRTYPDDEI